MKRLSFSILLPSVYIYEGGSKVSGLTHKSRAKWKILRGIYSAIYGEVNSPVSVCVEIKGDYTEK
jgi:hypothetical protein